MNIQALFKLTYGMYIIATEVEGKMNGQIANVGGQITDKPVRISICLNKNNLTTEMVNQRKAFTLSVLSEETPLKFIGKFGFKSGRDINKFDAETDYMKGSATGLPIVKNFAISYLETEVEQAIEIGNYMLFIARVVNADLLSEGTPMTYAYYHKVKGGFTAKNAPTYVDPKTIKEG